MCWSCNPYCGGCKPPKPKPVKCTQCKAVNFPELIHCKRCGALLPEPPKPIPAFCLYTDQMCANPCGRRKKPPENGVIQTCALHTPMPKDDSSPETAP
jgi:hypothetical protein